jgi:hypothetical protein
MGMGGELLVGWDLGFKPAVEVHGLPAAEAESRRWRGCEGG